MKPPSPLPAHHMAGKLRLGPALVAFALLTLIYIAILAFFDEHNRVFENVTRVAAPLPVIMALAFVSFVLRYLRWRWLLARRGFDIPLATGFLGYLSGFALTASPGKVGELVRVRYFAAMGIPTDEIVACFIFERALDLIAVLILASFLAGATGGLVLASSFVVVMLAVALVLALTAKQWTAVVWWLQTKEWLRAAKFVLLLARSLSTVVKFLNVATLAGSLALGLLAWGIQALGFVYLTSALGIVLPFLSAVALYPLALLVGAASMIPGGIGTTEVATVFFLREFGTGLEVATIAAVGMRFCTLWFAIALGLIAIATLEATAIRRGAL